MQPSPDTQIATTPSDVRLAYTPPKLERLDTGETQFSVIPNPGFDGLIYS